jgi:hypothetical protein
MYGAIEKRTVSDFASTAVLVNGPESYMANASSATQSHKSEI